MVWILKISFFEGSGFFGWLGNNQRLLGNNQLWTLDFWSSRSPSWTSMNVASGLELLMATWHREGPSRCHGKKRTIDWYLFQRIMQASFHGTKSPGRQVNQEPMKFHPFILVGLKRDFQKGLFDSICIYSMKNCIIPNVAWKKIRWNPKMEVWKITFQLSIGWVFRWTMLIRRVFFNLNNQVQFHYYMSAHQQNHHGITIPNLRHFILS